jgi:hypothetical protein
MASLAEQQVPLLVVAGSQRNRWVLIEGYARTLALRKPGIDKVWAVAPDLTEAQALVLRQCSHLTRRPSALEEGWLVREFIDGHGYEPGDVARAVDQLGVASPRTRGWRVARSPTSGAR